jgi:hypothetical protein
MDDQQSAHTLRRLSGSRRALLGFSAALGLAPLLTDAKKR